MAGMDADFAMQLLSQTLILAAEIAAPVLLATLVVGLLISIIQVVTQIQEATLTFVPKLVVVVVVLLLFGSWMLGSIAEFARHMIAYAANTGSMR